MCVKSQISSSNSFRDMRGSRIYTMGRCAPGTPLAKNVHTQRSIWPCVIVCKISTFCVWKFQRYWGNSASSRFCTPTNEGVHGTFDLDSTSQHQFPLLPLRGLNTLLVFGPAYRKQVSRSRLSNARARTGQLDRRTKTHTERKGELERGKCEREWVADATDGSTSCIRRW